MSSITHATVSGEVATNFVRHWDSLLAAVLARHLTEAEINGVVSLLDELGAPESARAWRDHYGDRAPVRWNWSASDGSPLLMTALGAGLERAGKARQVADGHITVLAAAETAYRVLERWPDATELVFRPGRWPISFARVVTSDSGDYPLDDNTAPNFGLLTVTNAGTWRPLCQATDADNVYRLPLAGALKAGRELLEGRR